MIKNKKLTEYLKYEFTDAEIADMARELARHNRRIASLEEDKKSVVAQFKADMDKVSADISRLSQFIVTGSEFRNVECTMVLDTPETGKKTVTRLDNNEVVRIVPMTDEDRQMALNLEAEADSKEPIVTPPPIIHQIEGPMEADEVVSGAPLAPAAVMGGTHQRKERRPRNPEQEAQADGSAE
jgi:hypothetical protein